LIYVFVISTIDLTTWRTCAATKCHSEVSALRLIMEECFGLAPYCFLTLAGKGIGLSNVAGK